VCTSRSDARRSVKGGGIKVNGRAVTAGSDSVALIGGRFALLQRGRKQRHLAVFGG